MSPEEETARRLAALASMEKSAEILKKFVQGAEDELIPTENGNIKPLIALVRDMSAHETEVTDFFSQVTSLLNSLVPEAPQGENP